MASEGIERYEIGNGDMWPREHGGFVTYLAHRAALSQARERALDEVREKLKAGPIEDRGLLSGSLGEAIANRSGNYSLSFCAPCHVRDGILDWLDSLAENKPQDRDRGGL